MNPYCETMWKIGVHLYTLLSVWGIAHAATNRERASKFVLHFVLKKSVLTAKKPLIISTEIHAFVRSLIKYENIPSLFSCDYLLLLSIIAFTIPVSFIIYHLIRVLTTKSTKRNRMNGQGNWLKSRFDLIW